jgi:glycosyltransferase involved in cell wall biosynthesis
MLTGDAKWGALSGAEAFLLPSHQENFGIAVVEALACGTPVLISDQVNVWREIVGDGAGLSEPDTAAGTSRLLARWLGMDAKARLAMAAAARQCFQKRYEIGASARNLVSVLSGDPPSAARS